MRQMEFTMSRPNLVKPGYERIMRRLLLPDSQSARSAVSVKLVTEEIQQNKGLQIEL